MASEQLVSSILDYFVVYNIEFSLVLSLIAYSCYSDALSSNILIGFLLFEVGLFFETIPSYLLQVGWFVLLFNTYSQVKRLEAKVRRVEKEIVNHRLNINVEKAEGKVLRMAKELARARSEKRENPENLKKSARTNTLLSKIAKLLY